MQEKSSRDLRNNKIAVFLGFSLLIKIECYERRFASRSRAIASRSATPTTRRRTKVMFKAIGILLYLCVMLLHYFIGNNELPFWVMLWYLAQNTAMCLFCLDIISSKKLGIKLAGRIGVTYFSSAALFYLYAFTTNQKIYFSNCGAAGIVLAALIVIAVLLTLIDAWRNGK